MIIFIFQYAKEAVRKYWDMYVAQMIRHMIIIVYWKRLGVLTNPSKWNTAGNAEVNHICLNEWFSSLLLLWNDSSVSFTTFKLLIISNNSIQNSDIHYVIFRWFHPNLTRHQAEALLIQNGCDGSYLLRESTNKSQYSLSVRCSNSVKHFQISWDGNEYTFGMGKFQSLNDFINHFHNKPLIGGESGK